VLPRFTGHGTRGPAWARAQVRCHFAALLLLVPSLGFGWSRAFAVGGVLMTLALGLFAWTIWPVLHAVRARPAGTSVATIAPVQIAVQSPVTPGGAAMSGRGGGARGDWTQGEDGWIV
jgi:hypothetical protein